MTAVENGRAKTRPAVEAWRLLFQFFMALNPYLDAIAAEFELSDSQGHALLLLDPDRPLPMHELADGLHCHASNVTGIVDALEARRIVERRPAEHDRRVKMIALTDDGRALRERALARLFEPPPQIAALSVAEQRALRDVMRKIVGA